MTTIAETPAASSVNGSDLVWIWQNGQLFSTTIDALVAAHANLSNSQLSSVSDGTIKSNISGSTSAPSDNTVTNIFDHVFGSTVGNLFYRGPSGWTVLPAGTSGYVLTSSGAGVAPAYQSLTGLSAISPSTVLANVTGGSAMPQAVSVASILEVIGSTRGSVLYRGGSGWTVLAPGAANYVLTANGAGADPAWAAAGSGTVTSVGLSGGTTGLTFSGAITTSGTITASGTLNIANGGTGAATIPGAQAALGISYYTKQSVTASSTSLNIDVSLGGTVALTLSSNVSVAFTVSNWPATGTQGRLLLEVTSTGAYNITAWPGAVIWQDGSTPVITPSGKDTILLTSNDGGSNFRGYIVSQGMS